MQTLPGYLSNLRVVPLHHVTKHNPRDIPLHSPSQMPNALLTTALIIWLDYHSTEEIPTLDGLLEVTITPLCVPLIIECSTRFILKKVQVATKHHSIARSGLEHNTWVWYYVSICSS